MSNASVSRPLGTAMVGGAIAMAVLDLLVRKNILTVDDVHLIDTGHFALEDKADEMIPLIRDFLCRKLGSR